MTPPPNRPLQVLQAPKLEALLRAIGTGENFNSRCAPAIAFGELPFTTREDLLADRLAHPPFGSALTEPLANYTRFCQTSGTSTGQPMAWIDTPKSWEAMLNCWRWVYRGAQLRKGEDRVFFAFSFGPFLGFWTAFEASATDYLTIPGGGLTSRARLEAMARYQATVLCCTPTYALRLGESLGGESGITIDQLAVRKVIVAGEPGGNVPGVRERIEKLWNARVFDHHGMTEVGPVSFESVERPGFLQIIEEAYLAEIIDPQTGREVAEGGCGELVLTTLDRTACPLVRYRTGDWVKKQIIDGRLCLEGGVLGRVDEMVVIRGVNIYPSAVEGVVRQFAGIAEFQVEQRKIEAMDEVTVLVELQPDAGPEVVRLLESKLRDTFSMRIPVRIAEGLPRFEFKARRWVKYGVPEVEDKKIGGQKE